MIAFANVFLRSESRGYHIESIYELIQESLTLNSFYCLVAITTLSLALMPLSNLFLRKISVWNNIF